MRKNSQANFKRWYAMSNEEICKTLKVNPKVGLTNEKAKIILETNGPNKLDEAKETNPFIVFLKTFVDPLAIIMLLAGFLAIILPLAVGQNIEKTEIPGIVVIFSVVFTNSIIATCQELRARNSLNALKSMTEQKVVVLREGKQQEINVEKLVHGDIVYLESGKFIPADIRIIEAPKLKVDESTLTGESIPVEKISDILDIEEPMLGEQINIGFMSTFVTNGKAIGIVVATGKDSVVGQIASSITTLKNKKTPLQNKLIQLTFWISMIAFIMATGIFFLQYFASSHSISKTDKLNSSLLFSLSAGIALIPESIMIIVTISLSLSAKKMVSRNVVVKTFNAIETLGAIDIICSDKTGTLTQNKMTIEKLFLNGKILEWEEFKYFNKSKQSWHFVNGFVLCSDAISEANNKIGDPTEIALTNWAHNYKISEIKIRNQFKRIDEIPFNSERKLMTTVNQIKDKKIVYVKGALDKLLNLCSKIYLNDKIIPLTKEMKEEIFQNTIPLLEKALRVLGLATKELKPNDKNNEETYENDLIFIGSVAMMDPPRKEAKLAVVRALDSGIRVIMITGDHKITALAIGKRIGIVNHKYNEALTGSEIDKLNDQELKERLTKVSVFARVNPEHKTRIVEILQSDKLIVAMTGDGVNDAPSLTKADVGIAMGITGTDVAKESANAILTDDNFATIISGVREGRNIYEKIKRSIAFLLGANFAQIFTILFILLFSAITNQDGKIIALGNINVLWHIILVETLLALPIALGHSREQVMSYSPRNKNESIFRWILNEIVSITFFNTLFAIIAFLIGYYLIGNDLSIVNIDGVEINERIKLSSLAAYVVIIFAPIFYASITQTRNYTVFVPKEKREKIKINEWLLGAIIISFILNIITLFVPGLNFFFNVPLPTEISWIKTISIIFISFGLSILVFLFKWLEGLSYEKTYQRIFKQNIKVSKFNFAKKQKRDRIKNLYKKNRNKSSKN
ncbi:MAG: cation-translocating P-type ATPase [Spiroplasma sp.]